MRIVSGAQQVITVLQSDALLFRNKDFVVDQNGAFHGSITVVAFAAKFAYTQIFNPSGSGVTLLVDGFMASIDVSEILRLTSNDRALDDDIASWPSRKLGGADGLGRLQRETDTFVNGTELGTRFMLANTSWDFEFAYPFELSEDQGLMLNCNIVNQGFRAIFYGREV